MATLQGQANSSEISNRIYQNIRSITPNHHPRHSRPMSASTRLSFPGSSRLSAKSLKESQTATQEAYSDFDIIKNRSWSANRVRSSSSHLGKAGWQKSGDTPLHPPGGSASTLIDPRPLLSPVSSPGTASPPVDGKGKQVSTRDLWNLRGSQVERLHQEWAAIEHCRTMKRASEMVQHRLDHMYRLSGSNIPLMARYHVNDTDMRRLREMTETNRILQLDLKRIKYPQGGQSSRREKTHRSKSQGKPESSSSQPAERGEEEAGGTDRGQETRDQIDGLTSPFPQPLPAVGDPPHPTSPVSTPEDTPRVAETEDQEESTRPGEASVTDNSFS